MNGSLAAAALVQSGLGVVLVLLGTWGRGAAASLAASRIDEDARARAEASYRRGSFASLGIGAVLLVFGLVALLGGRPD